MMLPLPLHRPLESSEVATFADLYPALADGELLSGTSDKRWKRAWDMAHTDSFRATA